MDGPKVFVRSVVCVAIATALTLACLVPVASARPARPGVSVERTQAFTIVRGGCSGSSRWRLAARRESGSLLVTLIVRSGTPNQRWNVFMDHNKRGFFAGSRVSDPRGVVGVRRTATNLPGVDRFRAAANNTVTGESCRGRVRT